MEKLHEVAEKEITRRVDLSKGIFRETVCSIYGVQSAIKNTHLGSGTLVSWNSNTWLLTARHLLKSGRNATEFFAVSERCERPITLSRRFVKSDEETDLAICALNVSKSRALVAKPIDARKFFTYPKPCNGRGIATIGWPNTRNQIDQYAVIMTPMIVSGPQKTAESLGDDINDDERYVFQKFYEKDALDQKGKQINPPKLTGLSGGLTFDLGNPIDPKIISEEAEFSVHPLGICTKYDPHRRVIRSTRPATFIRDVIESGIPLEV